MTNFKLSAKIRTALMVTTLAFASIGAANFAHADVAGHGSWVGKQKSIDGAWQIEKRNGQQCEAELFNLGSESAVSRSVTRKDRLLAGDIGVEEIYKCILQDLTP